MLRPGGRLKRFEFVALADGFIPGPPDASGGIAMTAPKGQTVYIGLPANPPAEQVLQAVTQKAKTMIEIKQLYLFQMSIGVGGAHTAVGIELGQKTEKVRLQEIMRALSLSIHSMIPKGDSLDFVVVEGSLGESIKQQGRKLLG